MKQIIKMAAITVLCIALGSCKKFLEVKPLVNPLVTDFYKSKKDIDASLAGLYASFQVEMIGTGSSAKRTDGIPASLGGKYHYWGEGRSDNFAPSQYFNATITELSRNTLTSGNAISNWEGLYRTIARANNCIKYFPGVTQYDANATTAVVNNAVAQAYAMRALCYFYIVRLWGDAPIRITPYDDLNLDPELPRESKEKIMDEVIIPDLIQAYSLINKKVASNVWSINEGGVAAILADAYMWRAGTKNNAADYTNAITWIKNVFAAFGPTGIAYNIADNAANLEPTATWKNLFLTPTATKEAIFSINWAPAQNGCACIPVSYQTSNNPVAMDSLLHANWQKNTLDTRVAKSYKTTVGVGNIDKVLKYYVTNAANTAIVGLPEINTVYLVMYRLADVYLLYAEALNKTGDRTNALRYLNYVHVRSGLPAILATDPSVSTGGALDETKLEDTILQERQWELFAEGKRWFDLVRTKHVNKVMDPIINNRILRSTGVQGTTGFGSNMDKILWPIYKTLLENNKKLIQNPSYE